MKKLFTFIGLILIVLMISCQKESFIRFGFDSPINKNSDGLVIADISNREKLIYLNGFITLTEGKLLVCLLAPNGDSIYTKTILATDELIINETFAARPGYWKLKYKSKEGVGKINLHLQSLEQEPI
jgi:hypothetical protein